MPYQTKPQALLESLMLAVVFHLSYRVGSFTDGFDDMKTRAEITTQIDLRDKKQSKWKTAAN